jgi:hypothetical protein
MFAKKSICEHTNNNAAVVKNRRDMLISLVTPTFYAGRSSAGVNEMPDDALRAGHDVIPLGPVIPRPAGPLGMLSKLMIERATREVIHPIMGKETIPNNKSNED